MFFDWGLLVLLIIATGAWAEYRNYQGKKKGREEAMEEARAFVRVAYHQTKDKLNADAQARHQELMDMIDGKGQEHVSPYMMIYLYSGVILGAGLVEIQGTNMVGRNGNTLPLSSFEYNKMVETERNRLTHLA